MGEVEYWAISHNGIYIEIACYPDDLEIKFEQRLRDATQDYKLVLVEVKEKSNG